MSGKTVKIKDIVMVFYAISVAVNERYRFKNSTTNKTRGGSQEEPILSHNLTELGASIFRVYIGLVLDANYHKYSNNICQIVTLIWKRQL